MARARDLKENLLLALQHDLAVVHTPRGEHDAIGINQLRTGQALIGLGFFAILIFVQLGIDFGRGHSVFFTPVVSVPHHCKSGVRCQVSGAGKSFQAEGRFLRPAQLRPFTWSWFILILMIRFLRPFDPRHIRLLVFDLDGTLIDSRLDLIHSVNAMLRHIGRPELEGDVIASYVGDGAPALVRRALGDTTTSAVARALEYFLGYYRMHKLDHTTVYEGIPETLARLAT